MAEDNKKSAAPAKFTHVARHEIQGHDNGKNRVVIAPGTLFTPASKAEATFLEEAGAAEKFDAGAAEAAE